MKSVWVRHGQSEYNAQNLSTGWHDPDLTEQGVIEAHQAGVVLAERYISVAGVYASDLRRSFNTANIIVETTGWHITPQVSPAIRERDYGDWSGKNKDQIKQELGEDKFLQIRRGWQASPVNGESLKDTAARVYGFLREIEDRANELPHIIICHGNTIRAAAVVLGKRTQEDVHEFEVHTGEVIEWDF
jgi:2,3-bisphosphoglycerate-dependent phosphoglycerate mutase